MRHFRLGIALVVALAQPGVAKEGPEAITPRAQLEQIAGQVPFLATEWVVADRFERSNLDAEPEAIQAAEQSFQALKHLSASVEALLPLLSDPDPKIRTLAAIVLFDREGPRALPALIRLTNDDAETYGRLETQVSRAGFDRPSAPPSIRPLERFTVGQLTRLMVNAYLEPAGFYFGASRQTEPGWAEYWEGHKDRAFCASWFQVQLFRASQGTSPTPPERRDAVRQVRAQITQVPEPDRTWLLLWLRDKPGSDILTSDEELVSTLSSLGPEPLLELLQNRIPSADPDLQPRRSNNFRYHAMARFILRRAEVLLRPRDSDALVAMDLWHGNFQKNGITDPNQTAWWAIAAARLNPRGARAILTDAFQRYEAKHQWHDRAELAVALWHHEGLAFGEFLTEWFFSEPTHLGAHPHAQGAFLAALCRKPDGRLMVAQLVNDPRFARIDWQSLERLVRCVNQWAGRPVVTEPELEAAWHPSGSSYQGNLTEAMRQYPRETEALEAQLSDWRQRLRAALALVAQGGSTRK